MTTEASRPFEPRAPLSLTRALQPARTGVVEQAERLERLHAYFLEGCPDEVRSALDDVLTRARSVREGCGDRDVGDDLASAWYAAAALIELAAALELDETDVRGAAAAVAVASALPLAAAS
jgi:hypothetical protein